MVNLLKNGFIRREDLDFTDDGARFQGYEYNRIPVTKTTYRGEYFIAIRVDYINKLFTYNDYKDTEWYKLCDKYNGVTEVDVEDLKRCIDIIREGVDTLNKKVSEEVIDYNEFDKQGLLEIAQIKEFISKIDLADLLELDEYKSKWVLDYLKSLKNESDTVMRKIANHTRYDYQSFIKSGYVYFDINNDFYLRQIKEILGI